MAAIEAVSILCLRTKFRILDGTVNPTDRMNTTILLRFLDVQGVVLSFPVPYSSGN
jgi:hypothetical protein